MIDYALLFVCSVLFAWKLSDLARNVHDAAAWSVTSACGAMAGTVLFAKPAVVAWADDALWTNASPVLRNLMLVASFAALQSFYLSHVATFRSRLRWWFEIVLASVVVAVAVTSSALVPAGTSLSKRSEYLHSTAVLVFFVTVSGYLCHACVTQIYWTVRFFRWLRRGSLKLSTLLIGAGCLLLLGLLVPQFVGYLAFATTGEPSLTGVTFVPALLGTRLGVGMLLAGLLLPIIVEDGARVLSAMHQIVDYLRLAPLDRAVIAAFPELVRPAQHGRVAVGARKLYQSPVRVGFAYHDRLQRCRDGCARALPFTIGSAPPDAPALRLLVSTLRSCAASSPHQRQTGEREHLLALAGSVRRVRRAGA